MLPIRKLKYAIVCHLIVGVFVIAGVDTDHAFAQFRLFSTAYLLVSLSGGADVILQELGLDLVLEVSEQGTVSLLPREGERKRRKERKGKERKSVNKPFFAVLRLFVWGKHHSRMHLILKSESYYWGYSVKT